MSSPPLDRLPPSTIAVAVATAIIAGLGGYFLGQGASIGLFGGASKAAGPKTSWPNSYDVKVHADSSDEAAGSSGEDNEDDDDDDEEESELKEFEDRAGEECKLVLVVRTDLGMTKGKIAAQCSHATLACYKYFLAHNPQSPILRRWERLGQAKVALQVRNEDELDLLQAQAVSLGLCAKVVHDAGRTQIASGSETVLGIGPGPKSVIDQVTGHLKLL